MVFCNVKRAAAVALAAALICTDALAFTREEVGESIYGIYNWKKGESGSLLAMLTPGESGSDWYAAAAAGYGIEDGSDYLARLEDYVSRKYLTEGGLSSSKATEWHRIAITVSALGGSCTDFGGVNLIEDGIINPIAPLSRQGINALIWAVIAADFTKAEVGEETINDICGKIVEKQNPDGGFSVSGASDPDITAMAIRALNKKPLFASYKALALAALKEMQNTLGGFSSMGAENCESTAQAILAFCAVGEDAEKAVARLMEYKNPDGGFAHVIGGESNAMASVQAMEALIAYENTLAPSVKTTSGLADTDFSPPGEKSEAEAQITLAEDGGDESDENAAEEAERESASEGEGAEEETEGIEKTQEIEADEENKAAEENQADEAPDESGGLSEPESSDGLTAAGISMAAVAAAAAAYAIYKKRKK